MLKTCEEGESLLKQWEEYHLPAEGRSEGFRI